MHEGMTTVPLQALAPAGIARPFGAYSHGVAGGFSQLAVTSGQLGMREDGSIPEGVAAQTELCLAAVRAILAEAGLGLAHLLRLNAYVVDRSHFPEYMAVRDRFLAEVNPKPCSTLMVVSGFTRPEFLVEVEALAGRQLPEASWNSARSGCAFPRQDR